ncbi:MAG: hypothetical protein HC902_01925 [Calothrix sp. SM1_5_4]|nr:hypothetical protein [Calothrix sp. SM1_5_4]
MRQVFSVSLFLFSLSLSLSAAAQGNVLPGEIPRVRWSPNPTFSEEGFRLGYIMRFQDKLFWHYEGDFMMGYGSSPKRVLDRGCQVEFEKRIAGQRSASARAALTEQMDEACFIEINPWPFSAVDGDLYKRYQAFGIEPVVLYYTTSINSFFGVTHTGSLRALMTNTRNYVQDVYRTNPGLTAPTYYSLETGALPIARRVNPAEGFAEGRIVKASLDHYFRKSYEITFQQGRMGSNFIRLSVNNSAMFDHLVLAMLTGKPVRLGFLRLFNIQNWAASIFFAYGTAYRVTSVELLSDDRPVPPEYEGSAGATVGPRHVYPKEALAGSSTRRNLGG